MLAACEACKPVPGTWRHGNCRRQVSPDPRTSTSCLDRNRVKVQPASSIADPKPDRQNKMNTQTPQPNTPIPARLTRHSRGVGNPSLLNNHPQLRNSPRLPSVIPSLPPSTKLEGSACAMAQALPSVFSSPSPLRALYRPGRRVTVVRGDR